MGKQFETLVQVWLVHAWYKTVCPYIHLVHARCALVHHAGTHTFGGSVERCGGVDVYQISGSSLVIYFGATFTRRVAHFSLLW